MGSVSGILEKSEGALEGRTNGKELGKAGSKGEMLRS